MTGERGGTTVELDSDRFASSYRVRFDESTPAGMLRTSGLLRYAQDIAWMHSEALGFDRAWYAERGLAWLVRAADVTVLAAVPMGTSLAVTTQVVGHRKVWARRRAEFRLPSGDLAGAVLTDWVMIDGRGRLARVPEVIALRFPAPMTIDPLLRVGLPAPPADARRRSFAVRPQELDPIGHVNNAVYLDWVEESQLLLGATDAANALAAIPRRYRLEYAAAAEAGALLEAVTWRHGDAWAHSIRSDGGAELLRALVGG